MSRPGRATVEQAPSGVWRVSARVDGERRDLFESTNPDRAKSYAHGWNQVNRDKGDPTP